ncbi:MAG: TIGR00282 family metallophosphoesterase [Proteobacteria bacterium]|nr:TIGR00282 family metallophosphoesterase [Pseudomonadota bacterium]
MKLLFLGDVVGRPGRRLVRDLLPRLVDRHQVDLVAINAENAAGGLGLTVKAAEELFADGADVLTSGNHIFRHKEIAEYLEETPRLIRPANYPEPAPGRGSTIVETSTGRKVGFVNVMGRVFMAPLDDPFRVAEREVEALVAAGAEAIVVDFHAEATSEKKAMGWFLDGRVGLVVGTHTHVQTADETVLPGGTAYISDLGMTGPHESIIGMKREGVLGAFLTGRPHRFEPAKRGLRLEGVLVELGGAGTRALNIQRIQEVSDLEKNSAF